MRIRDKEISILFIIGFTFLFILVCTGYVTVSNWLWQYKKQTVSYEYTKNLYIHSKNSYNAAYMDTELLDEQGYVEMDVEQQAECLKLCKKDNDSMVDILSNQVVTTYLSDLGLKVGESRKIVFLDVIFSYQETWYRDLAEGQYPLTGDNSTLCAVLGESLKSETVTMNGTSYIWIGDMYIPVVGVFENYNASEEDDSIVLFGGRTVYQNSKYFQKELGNIMNDDEAQIAIGSNVKPVSSETFEDMLKQNDNLYLGEPGYLLKRQLARQESGLSRNFWDYLYNIKSMVVCIMGLFGIINCVMLARVWTMRRQKDFLVMRLYGISNCKIIWLVFQELSMVAGIGLLLAAVISTSYISIIDGWRASEHMVAWLILILVCGFVLTLAVCILSVCLFINKMKSIQVTKI